MARRNGALRHAAGSVIDVVVVQPEPMPVDRGSRAPGQSRAYFSRDSFWRVSSRFYASKAVHIRTHLLSAG